MVSILLALAYGIVMLVYWFGWRKQEIWAVPAGFKPKTRVSVVIPARNEAENIGPCLRSILKIDYPEDLFEIVVVDDFSEDGTPALVSQMAENQRVAIRLIPLSQFFSPAGKFLSFKKKAIETAVAHASGELIVTTDADCLVQKNWLLLLVSAFETRSPKMIAAPVQFFRERNILGRFQALDFLGMMGITGAGIRLGFQRIGNGANLSYSKSAFYEVGGFSGNENFASGDDVFLMQKMAARWPEGVMFLKNRDASVFTEPKHGLKDFLAQRVRWGTKNAASPEFSVKLVLAIVFLFCWSILVNFGLAVFGFADLRVLAVQLLAKSVFDWLFLREMWCFFDRKDLSRWFLPAFFMHTTYIAIVGAMGVFLKKYEWKGRRVR